MRVRIILMISMMQIMLWGGAGDLDSSFGSDGIVTTDFGSDYDKARSVAIQNDNKIIVVGRADSISNTYIAVVRYDIDGSLDSTFGSDGKVTTNIGNNSSANSVAIQSNGKIVAAGTIDNGSYNDFAVVRYDTDGSLDSTFSGDGIVTTAIGSSSDEANSVAIQNDGKIVVVGASDNGSNRDFAVVRYDINGSLDSTFDSDGKVTTDFGGSKGDYANSVAIQSDGKIVVAGTSNNDFAVVRYDTNGSLDSTFGSSGKVTTAVSLSDQAYGVAIQSDGKIVVSGASLRGNSHVFCTVRYDTSGSLDSSFGSDGIVRTDFESIFNGAHSVAIQSDGKIVVAGAGNGDLAVARYDTSGSLDSTFGSDGKVTTDFESGEDGAYSVAIQNDGKIVAVGDTYNGSNSDFAVVRYMGDSTITLAPIYYLLQ